MHGVVQAVHLSPTHTMGKCPAPEIRLLTGAGVEGDAHAGSLVKHRSRVRVDPTAPNLRQVHLLHTELHDALKREGFEVKPGVMGENITTRSLPRLELARGTLLHLGPEAIVEITGLRNPCSQLDGIQDGLMGAVLDRDAAGGWSARQA